MQGSSKAVEGGGRRWEVLGVCTSNLAVASAAWQEGCEARCGCGAARCGEGEEGGEGEGAARSPWSYAAQRVMK